MYICRPLRNLNTRKYTGVLLYFLRLPANFQPKLHASRLISVLPPGRFREINRSGRRNLRKNTHSKLELRRWCQTQTRKYNYLQIHIYFTLSPKYVLAFPIGDTETPFKFVGKQSREFSSRALSQINSARLRIKSNNINANESNMRRWM